jgi:hypothetical protein
MKLRTARRCIFLVLTADALPGCKQQSRFAFPAKRFRKCRAVNAVTTHQALEGGHISRWPRNRNSARFMQAGGALGLGQCVRQDPAQLQGYRPQYGGRRWDGGGRQVAVGWQSGGSQVAVMGPTLRWQLSGSQGASKLQLGGSQLAVKWQPGGRSSLLHSRARHQQQAHLSGRIGCMGGNWWKIVCHQGTRRAVQSGRS